MKYVQLKKGQLGKLMITHDGKTRTIDVANFIMCVKRLRQQQRQHFLPICVERVYTRLRQRFVQDYGLANWQLFLDDMGL